MNSRCIRFAFLLLVVFGISTQCTHCYASSAPKKYYHANEIIIKFKDSDSHINQLPEEQGDTEPPSHRSIETLNNKYKLRKTKHISKTRKVKQLNKHSKSGPDRVNQNSQKQKPAKTPKLYTYTFHESEYAIEEIIQEYRNDPSVEYAELNYSVSACLEPDDTYFHLLWGLKNTGSYFSGTADADIDATNAWNVTTGSSNIVVAVIDTGIDYTHRDIYQNIWINEAEYNGFAGVDDDGNGYVDDLYGYDFYNDDSDPLDDDNHGTHCAGTISARGDNNTDITGICWNTKVMALKFLNENGSGYLSDAIRAIYYAINNGADVISNSWGSYNFSSSLRDAFNDAYTSGIVITGAAGNDDTTSRFYPAAYSSVISVAATDMDDEKAWFSNYGSWVDIAAPGDTILSLLPGNSVGYMSGTSMACPHVAGSAALLLSVNPDLTPAEIKDILMNNTDSISSEICQSGRLNLNQSMIVCQTTLTRTIDENKTLQFTVSGLDAQAENISTSSLTLPDGATFENAVFTWRPWYDQAGLYNITFSGNQQSITIPIVVNNIELLEWYELWLQSLGYL